MIHYFKADLFKIQKEQRLTVSLGVLALLSFLSAFLLHGNEDFTSSLIQLLSQFITLFLSSQQTYSLEKILLTVPSIILLSSNKQEKGCFSIKS